MAIFHIKQSLTFKMIYFIFLARSHGYFYFSWENAWYTLHMWKSNYQTCLFEQFQKKICKGLGSSHPETRIIFQFVPSFPHLFGFFQNVEVPNFFFFLPERRPSILWGTKKKPMWSIGNNSIFQIKNLKKILYFVFSILYCSKLYCYLVLM